MNLSDEIRKQIEKNKGVKLAIGEINNHLSILENLVRKDIMEQVDEAYQKGLEEGKKAFDLLDAKRDSEYQRGLNDAWDCAKRISIHPHNGGMTCTEISAAFGEASATNVFYKCSAQQAIEKLKAYEEKQKAEDKIVVGDEVAFHHDDGRPDTVVVVTYIGQDGFIDGMDGRGTQYAHKNPTKWTKTGRHFDIGKILEEMRK